MTTETNPPSLPQSNESLPLSGRNMVPQTLDQYGRRALDVCVTLDRGKPKRGIVGFNPLAKPLKGFGPRRSSS